MIYIQLSVRNKQFMTKCNFFVVSLYWKFPLNTNHQPTKIQVPAGHTSDTVPQKF